MKVEVPEISPDDAHKAMALAKTLFNKYKVSPPDQDLLYNAILTMGMAALVTAQNNDLLGQLGITKS